MSESQTGYKSTFKYDSIFGGLNMFKRKDQRFLYRQSDRTPYPIIVDRPTLRQALSNFNKADFGITIAASFVGFFLARQATKPCSSEYIRQRLFSATWTTTALFGGIMGLQNSHMRLQGFVDNGLQWKRKNNALNKYDFTSEYEQETIWKHFRIRE